MDTKAKRLAQKIRELRELYAVLETALCQWGPTEIRSLRLDIERREAERHDRAA
jgi:hypothetical protein